MINNRIISKTTTVWIKKKLFRNQNSEFILMYSEWILRKGHMKKDNEPFNDDLFIIKESRRYVSLTWNNSENCDISLLHKLALNILNFCWFWDVDWIQIIIKMNIFKFVTTEEIWSSLEELHDFQTLG